jgi:hypothetical protein
LLPIDRRDVHDPQAMSEYAEDVFKHMIRTEKSFIPSAGYLQKGCV